MLVSQRSTKKKKLLNNNYRTTFSTSFTLNTFILNKNRPQMSTYCVPEETSLNPPSSRKWIFKKLVYNRRKGEKMREIVGENSHLHNFPLIQ